MQKWKIEGCIESAAFLQWQTRPWTGDFTSYRKKTERAPGFLSLKLGTEVEDEERKGLREALLQSAPKSWSLTDEPNDFYEA